jgi:phosphoribosyl-AMP cyclohydrolase
MAPQDILERLDFEKRGGVVMAIAQDEASGEVLMTAFMNRESFRATLETGRVVYWSTSRGRLWPKGEESGNVQVVKGIYVDCDGDAVLLRVEQKGRAACHTGKRSCFSWKLEGERWTDVGEQVFDPAEVYGR